MTLRTVLEAGRQKVLDRLVERVRRAEFGDGGGEAFPRVVLLDGLPAFLDQLIQALKELEDPGEALGASSTTLEAMKHGMQRKDLGFELTEVVREYGMLHDIILELCAEEEAQLKLGELRLLSRHIHSGAAEAADYFLRARDLERAQLQARHVGFLAHELRTKLTAAAATMSWWRRSRDAAELAVRTLDESLNDLSMLVDGELISQRLEHLDKGWELKREQVAAAELVYAALKDVRPLAEARGVTIGSSSDPGQSVSVDVRLVRAALVNLLANAVKFTPSGGRVEVRVLSKETETVIEVEDQGHGIPAASAELVFTPYAQVGPDRSGHGLGLAIARQAIEAHGGRISVETATDRGSVFRVHLPVP